MSKKTVYVGLSADIIHHGHINILNTASNYGNITVGLLTDEAIESYKRVPINTYNDRLKVIKNMKNITNIIPQTTLDYRPNLRKIKPDYVVHGSDWKEGPQAEDEKTGNRNII